MMKSIYNNIYILCPKKYTSGGPEALHQLAYYLSLNFESVFISYFNALSDDDNIVPPRYAMYNVKTIGFKEINDLPDNFVIIPENLYRLGKIYKHAKIAIWWLSVNNFHESSVKSDIKFLFRALSYKKIYLIQKYMSVFSFRKVRAEYNFAASYYAMEYIKKKQLKNPKLLIEPISKDFLDLYNPSKVENGKRCDIILYNPKKGRAFTEKLICESNGKFRFLPLENYSVEELIDLFSSAKLYIDFGEFPGAERLPKEAVLYGCLVITGKNGASAFYEDVVIADDFKWEAKTESIEPIIRQIGDMLDRYQDYYHCFDNYRNVVLNLESNFQKKLLEYFSDKSEQENA